MAPAATGMTPAATGVASARKSRGMFAAAVMTSITCMAMTVLRLVSMEMVERLLALYRIRPVVAVARIVAVVDMPIKSVRPVKPGSGSDEHPSEKPIRPVITVGRTLVRSIVEIAIGTNRWCPNADGYLRRCTGKRAQHGRSERRKSKEFQRLHRILPYPIGLDHDSHRKVV
jgi:hypothetical protein